MFVNHTSSQLRGLVVESSLAKHGRLGLILSWVISKTLKLVSAASLALTLSI